MSVESTLKERSRYGEFDTHSFLSQQLKTAMVTHTIAATETYNYNTPYSRLPADMKEALEMIQHKIARIINGDPNYTDNWHDIQGYAKLIEDRLRKDSRDE